MVVPVVVHHRRSGVVRDGDGREARVGGEAPPEPVRGGAALGEGGEDRGSAGDVAVDDVLVAVLGRGPFEAVERHEAAGHVQQVGDLLDAPPLVGGGVLGVVGHGPEVVLVDVPCVAVEVLQRRLVAGGAAADQRVPVQVAPVQAVGLAVGPTARGGRRADRGRPPRASCVARRRPKPTGGRRWWRGLPTPWPSAPPVRPRARRARSPRRGDRPGRGTRGRRSPRSSRRARRIRPSVWVASTTPVTVAASATSSSGASVPPNVVGGHQPSGPRACAAASQ